MSTINCAVPRAERSAVATRTKIAISKETGDPVTESRRTLAAHAVASAVRAGAAGVLGQDTFPADGMSDTESASSSDCGDGVDQPSSSDGE